MLRVLPNITGTTQMTQMLLVEHTMRHIEGWRRVASAESELLSLLQSVRHMRWIAGDYREYRRGRRLAYDGRAVKLSAHAPSFHNGSDAVLRASDPTADAPVSARAEALLRGHQARAQIWGHRCRSRPQHYYSLCKNSAR